MKHPPETVRPLKVSWPEAPFHVALVEPEIPPNTGSVGRLCAATGSVLHLVGPLGFHITDKEVRRAGLDYWDAVRLVRHEDFSGFARPFAAGRIHLFSARGSRPYTAAAFEPGDALVFGCETKGLPDELLAAYPDHVWAIPIRKDSVRSLNLATAVAIVLYEALRITCRW